MFSVSDAEPRSTLSSRRFFLFPFGQNVASVLIDRGRLHLPELCHYTRLRSRTVQSVLIVLLQHNLLWRSELPFMGSLVEFFEVDLKECLLRCRWARMLAMTEDEFGEDGVRIVTEVMVRGKARVGDIVDALSGAGGGGSSASESGSKIANFW